MTMIYYKNCNNRIVIIGSIIQNYICIYIYINQNNIISYKIKIIVILTGQ